MLTRNLEQATDENYERSCLERVVLDHQPGQERRLFKYVNREGAEEARHAPLEKTSATKHIANAVERAV